MRQIITEYSLWYLLPCLAIGAGYAYLLYSKKDVPWSKNTNFALAGVRFVLVLLILLLLLGLYTRHIENTPERPILAIALDNSQSLPLGAGNEAAQTLLANAQRLAQAAQAQNMEVAFFTLQGKSSPDSIQSAKFDRGTTNLSSLLGAVSSEYENRNLAGMVLLSDGIYNEGLSPAYLPYRVPVHAICIGDTVPRKDVTIRAVYANRIAYLGNKFPIAAELQHWGFAGKKAKLRLLHKDKVLAEQEVNLEAETQLQRLEFLVEASEAGMQRYQLEIAPLEGEFTLKNNAKNVYIEVLDNRQKVLIVGAAPHPDIKAIRSAIESQQSYQVDVYLPRLSANPMGNGRNIDLNTAYNLYIFHQIPNTDNIAADVLKKASDQKAAVWFIGGSQTNYAALSQAQQLGSVNSGSAQRDQVTPAYNGNFDKFEISKEFQSIISKYPPVSAPFGEYRQSPAASVVLYQRVGSVATNRPLLTVGEIDGRKTAIMFGEGIWQWRMQEYAGEQSQEAFDAMVGKLVQYLASQEDKKKFRVYPSQDELMAGEPVLFNTEVYNDVYEPIYGQTVKLLITNEKGATRTFEYLNAGPGFQYTVSGLEPGVYRYKASTTLNGQTVSSDGQFVLKDQALEALHTTADFALLRNLARQTKGKSWHASQFDKAQEELLANRPPDIIHTEESLTDLLRLPWLFALLITLATLEWAVRKYKGGY